jgi:hypothetical protein
VNTVVAWNSCLPTDKLSNKWESGDGTGGASGGIG